ncbi:cellulose synthase subunit BcsC-related outer membrane protein [Shigella flexneri]
MRTRQSDGAAPRSHWLPKWHLERGSGTAPMGFNVVDVVGGLSYGGDVVRWAIRLTHTVVRISSSLLAFGGQKIMTRIRHRHNLGWRPR